MESSDAITSRTSPEEVVSKERGDSGKSPHEWEFHLVETFSISMSSPSLATDIFISGQHDNAKLKHLPSRRELILTTEQIGAIQSLIVEMRLLEGATNIKGHADSSLCEGTMEIEGFVTNDSIRVPFSFSMWFMHSGFFGDDAPTLQKLLEYFENLLPKVDLYQLLKYGHR
jgi:hypothetical protein